MDIDWKAEEAKAEAEIAHCQTQLTNWTARGQAAAGVLGYVRQKMAESAVGAARDPGIIVVPEAPKPRKKV